MKKEIEMINYFDCSINEISEKLHSVDSYGPKENDIMFDLNLYSECFGFKRVYDYKLADIIITNTYYTRDILDWAKSKNIPLVKRMDGIYWKKDILDKNTKHIESSKQSDHVIFISEYSRNSLTELYNINIKNNSVVLNNAPCYISKSDYELKDNFKWVSVCSNWGRFDKRLNEIIRMSELLPDDVFTLIGHCDLELPKNIIKTGYIEDRKEVQEIMINSDAFLSLFFRDAGSKVTTQAVQARLPILYTSSGGLPELVKNNGVIVNDHNGIDFRNDVPDLDMDHVINQSNILKNRYKHLIDNYNEPEDYKNTIENYFKLLNSISFTNT